MRPSQVSCVSCLLFHCCRSSSDAYVVITSGGESKHDGKLAKILEKNKENCEAYLQLIEDRDVALRVKFDDICEYAGDVEAFDQF